MTDKLTQLLDGLTTPACMIAVDGTLLFANYEFIELAYISPRKMRKGLSIEECLKLNVMHQNENVLEKVSTTGVNVKLREVTAKNAEGKRLSLCASFIPASLFEAENKSVIAVFSDLTEEEDVHEKYKKLYEKEKEEREKLAEFNVRLNELVDEKTQELKKAYNELSSELEIARTVQSGLLPKELPHLVNMDIATYYIPTGKVGGDLYDIIITKDRKVALLIFDVSGHGVPAALIAAMAKMLFHYYIEKSDSPAEIFAEINVRLGNFIQTGHYITAFLGFLDPSNNSMLYSRAGHAQPIIYDSHKKECYNLSEGGVFLGHPALIDIAKYSDTRITLNWHDKILLYTDGLTESTNKSFQMYDKKRLCELATEHHELNPEELINKIITDNQQFRQGCELDDDLSLVIVQIGCNESLLRQSGFSKEDSPGILTFSSHDEIEGICSVILRELDINGYPTQHFFHAHLCIHEMLANAVRHGNKYDTAKKVLVFYKINLDSFAISIIDEGDGFDYSAMPDPLSPENITKEYGRGLFLINNYMDEVSFNEKGNRILAKKYIKQSL